MYTTELNKETDIEEELHIVNDKQEYLRSYLDKRRRLMIAIVIATALISLVLYYLWSSLFIPVFAIGAMLMTILIGNQLNLKYENELHELVNKKYHLQMTEALSNAYRGYNGDD